MHELKSSLVPMVAGLLASLACATQPIAVKPTRHEATPPIARLRVRVATFKDRSAVLVSEGAAQTGAVPFFGGAISSETGTDGTVLAQTLPADLSNALTLSSRFDVTPVLDDCDLLLVGAISAAAGGHLTADLRLVSCFTRGDLATAHVTLDYESVRGVLHPTPATLEVAMKSLIAGLPDSSTLRKGRVLSRSGLDVTIAVEGASIIPKGLSAISLRYAAAPVDPAAPGLLGGETLTGRLWVEDGEPGQLHAKLVDGAEGATQPGDYVLFK